MAGELADGETTQVKGSGSAVYTLKNSGGVYSCSCPAWRNQGAAPERRTCKHIRALRGVEAEAARLGADTDASPARIPAEPSDAPPLLLAHSWEDDADLTGWWMSEKLDGVRAYWDGERLISRLGNTFVAPEWFVAGLPRDLPLDGELFSGRKRFQRTVGIVRRQDKSDAWREIAYVVFDAPKLFGPFEERMRAVEAAVAAANVDYLRAHPHEPCRGTAHLRQELARVEALGGEGLMLRRPASLYEVGRSSSLLKVKTFKDAEARVIGHQPGAGRHKGRLGALACELADGTRFSVGTGLSDDERRDPPAIGAVITFRYQELSDDGVPRFPSYVGVRDDVVFLPKVVPTVEVAADRRTASQQRAEAAAKAARATKTVREQDASRTFRGPSQTVTLTLRGAELRSVVDGDTTVQSFATGADAWRHADSRIAELLARGLVEVIA